jgi:hypothetical protein
MNSNKVLPYLTLLFISFFTGQFAGLSQKSGNYLVIEVTHIDTLRLIDAEYDTLFSKGGRGIENTMAQVVHFKVLEKMGKQKAKVKNIIVTPVMFSDHICIYDFRVGRRYKLPVNVSRYSSGLIRKELQGWHYNTSCSNMPTLVPGNSDNSSFKKEG